MKQKTLIFIFLAIVLLSIGAIFLTRLTPGGKIATIYQDGVLVRTVDLSDVKEAYEIELRDGDGRNVILVEPGKISMADANCPDRLCVRQGAISNGVYPIVCLPHRIVIEIKDEGADTEIDAISGRGTE